MADDQHADDHDEVKQPSHEGMAEVSMGWLTSMLIHIGLFILLTLLTLPELPTGLGPLLEVDSTSLESIDDSLEIEDLTVEISSELSESLNLDSAMADSPNELLESNLGSTLTTAQPVSLKLDSLSSPLLSTSTDILGEGADGRTGQAKSSLIQSKGGTKRSEVAVARGLKWIAEHQNRDGTWSLVHGLGPCNGRCANSSSVGKKDPEKGFRDSLISGTSLALLPYLGAGHTHKTGKYKKLVERGLSALILLGKEAKGEGAQGIAWRDSGRTYAHAISAIVLTEAYGLTRDPDLLIPAQAAIDYLAYAQDPAGGGWRYSAQQAGDTSATGWPLMALKSAQLAELRVPPRVIKRSSKFFDSVKTKKGNRYKYTPKSEKGSPTLTAVALLCRMYLGADQQNKELQQGAMYLAKRGPSKENYYYNYYAAQTVYHATGGEGPIWRSWNEPTRELLIDQQETRGHMRGSWWIDGPHNKRGGRLYMTSLATMTLEVYYRYLPLFQSESVLTEFPD